MKERRREVPKRSRLKKFFSNSIHVSRRVEYVAMKFGDAHKTGTEQGEGKKRRRRRRRRNVNRCSKKYYHADQKKKKTHF